MISVIKELSYWIIPALLFFIPVFGFIRGVKVYESFVTGAKEGFNTAVTIIPYLVAMLTAIGIFRASGSMKILEDIIKPMVKLLGIPVETISLAIMRPLSGTGSLGLMTEMIKEYGPDSLVGKIAAVVQGSTETTFYVIAVYFGAVGIKKIRHTLVACLTADIFAFLAAVFLVKLLLD